MANMKMKLFNKYFLLTIVDLKTIEIRRNDEKRKSLEVSDIITFTNELENMIFELDVKVIAIRKHKTIDDLLTYENASKLGMGDTGWHAKKESIKKLYPEFDELLAIEFKRIGDMRTIDKEDKEDVGKYFKGRDPKRN